MRQYGVVYDVGRAMGPRSLNWRPDYSPELVRRELDIIGTDLGANAVRLCARDPARLLPAAEYALDLGLSVWLCPELWNATAGPTLAYLAEVAPAAEALGRRFPDRLTFVVGNELTLFMRGIVPGRDHHHRMRARAQIRAGEHNPPLRAFLADAVAAVRRSYGGPVSYCALAFEAPDWSIFDIIGVNLYRHGRSGSVYDRTLDRLLGSGKPVAITELGFAASRDADNPEFLSTLNATNLSLAASALPGIGRYVRPRVRAVHPRDEPAQARLLIAQLEDLERRGVDTTFVMSFCFPLAPYSEDPRHDIDATALSLVRTLPRDRRGTTYPDMPWEPKLAFGALAEFHRTRS